MLFIHLDDPGFKVDTFPAALLLPSALASTFRAEVVPAGLTTLTSTRDGGGGGADLNRVDGRSSSQ